MSCLKEILNDFLHDAGNRLTVAGGQVRKIQKALAAGDTAKIEIAVKALQSELDRLASLNKSAKLQIVDEDSQEIRADKKVAQAQSVVLAVPGSGAISGGGGIETNTNDQIPIENKLDDEQQRTKKIIDTMQEGLVVYDASASITYHNDAASKILGLADGQLVGESSASLPIETLRADMSPMPREEIPSFKALISGESVSNVLVGVIRPGDSRKWVRVNAKPFEGTSSASKPLNQVPANRQVVVSFADVTEMIEAKTQLDSYFSASLDLICIANTDGFFKRINPSFKRLLGYETSELLSEKFLNFIHPDDIASTNDVIASLASGKTLLNFENRYRTKSGDYLNISWHCQPDAKTGDLFATGRDVTEQRKAERKLNRFMDALNESAIVAFTDRKGRITEANDNFCHITGYSREEILGKTHRLINSGEHEAAFFADMWKTIAAGNTWTGDIKNKRKDGTYYWVRTVICSVQDVEDTDDENATYVAIRFDITNQKAAEELNKKISEDLLVAQSTAKVGSWHLDLADYSLTMSAENYKIFEIAYPQDPQVLYEMYLSRIHKDDQIRFKVLLEKAATSGNDFTCDHRIVCQDGALKHVQVIGRVTQNSDRNSPQIRGTCQDVTVRVQKEEENRFILDALGIGVWTLDPKCQEFTMDESMYKLYGINRDDFSSHSNAWRSSLSPEVKSKLDDEIAMALRGEKEFNIDFEVTTHSEGQKIIAGRGKVVRNDSGDPIVMYGVCYDRTKEEQAAKELEKEKVNSIRTAKLASLGEMSAGIAHEINNPLTIIYGTVRTLLKFADNPSKLEEKIGTIQKASERIAKIVKSLKKYSRTSDNSDYSVHELDSIVEEVIILTDAKAKRNGATVHVSTKGDSRVFCDEIEIEQVLVNLVSNALDAVKDLKDRWVQVNLNETPGGVVLQVRDSGSGIAKDVEDKLFNPFFTTKAVGEGTGLGLSIVKSILSEHQATIEVNHTDEHTCFEIHFQKIEGRKDAA